LTPSDLVDAPEDMEDDDPDDGPLERGASWDRVGEDPERTAEGGFLEAPPWGSRTVLGPAGWAAFPSGLEIRPESPPDSPRPRLTVEPPASRRAADASPDNPARLPEYRTARPPASGSLVPETRGSSRSADARRLG